MTTQAYGQKRHVVTITLAYVDHKILKPLRAEIRSFLSRWSFSGHVLGCAYFSPAQFELLHSNTSQLPGVTLMF